MQNTNRAQESGYKASLTREQFLFHEMRIVAKQMVQGEDLASMIQIIAANNLFQYPTERMTAGMVRACYRRLNLLNSEQLLRNIAEHSVEEAKQICLYAIMKDNRLVWDFMVTVIGEKYRNQDFSYGKLDMTSFFIRLQEQHDAIADWSEATVKKLKSVLKRFRSKVPPARALPSSQRTPAAEWTVHASVCRSLAGARPAGQARSLRRITPSGSRPSMHKAPA